MRKSYIVIKDEQGNELENKIAKGYKSIKTFKRYNLRRCLIGLERKTVHKWHSMDIYSYDTFKDLIDKNLEFSGTITKQEYKAYMRAERKRIKERKLKENALYK